MDVEAQALEQAAQLPDAPFLGVQSLSTDGQSGITILGTFENGPARAAGIQNNDIILALNEAPTLSLKALRSAMLAHKPGDTVKVKLRRAGETMEVDLTFVRRGDFFPGMSKK